MEADDGGAGGQKRPAEEGEQLVGGPKKRARGPRPQAELSENQIEVKEALEKVVEGADKQLLNAAFILAFTFNGADYEFSLPLIKTSSVPEKLAQAPCMAGHRAVQLLAFVASVKQAIADAVMPRAARVAKKDRKGNDAVVGEPAAAADDGGDDAGGDGAAAGGGEQAGGAVGAAAEVAGAAPARRPAKATMATILKTIDDASRAERPAPAAPAAGGESPSAAAPAPAADGPPGVEPGNVVENLSLSLRCRITDAGRASCGDEPDFVLGDLPLEELADVIGPCGNKMGQEQNEALRAAVVGKPPGGGVSMEEAVKKYRDDNKAQLRAAKKLEEERKKERELREEIVALRKELRELRGAAAAAPPTAAAAAKKPATAAGVA